MRLLTLPGSVREAVVIRIQQLLSGRQVSGPSRTDPEDEEGLLQDEKEAVPSPSIGTFFAQSSRRTPLAILFVGLILVALALLVSTTGASSSWRSKKQPFRWNTTGISEDHHFHVVIPAQERGGEFCKTLLTGAVLNYPPPWVVGWQPRLDDQGRELSDTFLKLDAVTQFLYSLPERNEDDIMLILGNERTWFQLRPEVLLRRYLTIADNEIQRLAGKFGKTAVDVQETRADVLFAADDTCRSTGINGTGCLEIQASGKALRYLSHDFVLGPVRGLKAMYAKAMDKAKGASDAGVSFDKSAIFSQLLYEQAMHRGAIAALAPADVKVPLQEDNQDFGITLDFDGDLRYAASPSGDDAAFSNRRRLPEDIAQSQAPLWILSAKLPSLSWSQVPLLADPKSNTIPAMIQRHPFQFNPSSSPRDKISQPWYEKLFFQPHGRAMLDSHALTPDIPVAVLAPTKKNPVRRRYYAPTSGKAGVKSVDTEFHKWEEICGGPEYARELFLDDLGPWVDPRP